uniref:Transmembrane protein 82 n=1 Tax=Oncorhynchus mykiss TaxID=8022 RepID=A0A8C7TW22_ONCMY
SSRDTSMQKIPRHQASTKIGLSEALQFLFLPVMQSVVGSRVASLVVLEFSLRTMSVKKINECQFSLGCALSCGLHFLHEGATELVPGRLRLHVMALHRLHSLLCYCGVCMTLLTSGLAAIAPLRFWTPLTICYTLLVVYMQGERLNIHILLSFSLRKLMIIIFYSWGRLMVLMLIVGRWADVVHIILCFLGEASCLIPSRDLLDATCQNDYRPVALASVTMKCFERLVMAHINTIIP